jgi:histidinol-phosphate aminotransferase
VAQAAALAAIDDREHVHRSIESNRAGLAQLSSGLTKLGIKFVPSFTNFILVDFGFETEPLCGEFLKRGVIVRPMRWMGFPNCIRVSVGIPEENEKFLQVLTELRASQHHNSHKRRK